MVSTCSRPQIVPSLHIHLQSVKAHPILLTAAISERMCKVASTAMDVSKNDRNVRTVLPGRVCVRIFSAKFGLMAIPRGIARMFTRSQAIRTSRTCVESLPLVMVVIVPHHLHERAHHTAPSSRACSHWPQGPLLLALAPPPGECHRSRLRFLHQKEPFLTNSPPLHHPFVTTVVFNRGICSSDRPLS